MSDFYEAFYRKAKERMPEFQFEEVKNLALPLSGANARWKVSGPSIFEKIALPELRPGKLTDLKPAELKEVLRRVDKMFKSARRAKEDVEPFRKAASWVAQEMKERNVSVNRTLAVLQGYVGKSEEEIEKSLQAEAVRDAPTNERTYNVPETIALVAEHGRFSQSNAAYRERAPEPYVTCGGCRFFMRSAESEVGTCQAVQGDINWYATCDYYISATAEARHVFHMAREAVNEAMLDQALSVSKAYGGDGSNDDNNTDPQKPKMIITAKEMIEKRVKKTPEGKYQVTTDDGKKVLGTHATRAEAIRQLAAVESNVEKGGPTVATVHQPGSDDEIKKKKDRMGALTAPPEADNVTNEPESPDVKKKPKATPDSVTNTDGAAKVKKDESERVEVDLKVEIAKIDDEKKKIYGIVLEPDEVDTQGDTITADEIEKSAEGFMAKARTIGLRHMKIAKGVILTDSYVTQGETTLGKTKLKKGTWIIGVKVENDVIWKGVKAGEYNGFSVGGFGKREKNA